MQQNILQKDSLKTDFNAKHTEVIIHLRKRNWADTNAFASNHNVKLKRQKKKKFPCRINTIPQIILLLSFLKPFQATHCCRDFYLQHHKPPTQQGRCPVLVPPALPCSPGHPGSPHLARLGTSHECHQRSQPFLTPVCQADLSRVYF